MRYQISEIIQVLKPEHYVLNIEEATISELLTDSRSLTYPAVTLFFALRTKNNDGHRYIAELYDRGVRNFVVESLDDIPWKEMNANILVVDDTLAALQAIATFHRRRFNIPVISITGSRGKTTVKEWLYQLLCLDYNIVRSPRSYNSQIGVPLSLWDIDDNTTLAIIEAGISMAGEMKSLQAMIRPEIGVFTNLGSEHREGFYSAEEMASEKAQLFTNCDSIIYCADDPLVYNAVAPMLEVAQGTPWSLSNDSCPVAVNSIDKQGGHAVISVSINGEPIDIKVPFTSDIEISNALCCAAVMAALNISNAVIAERISRLTPVDTRLSVIYGVNNCLLVADSYTSDYNSLGPAINFMQRRVTAGQSLTVILSDVMRESYREDDLYERIGNLLEATDIHRVIGIGKEMCAHAMEFGVDFQCFESTKEFLEKTSQGDFENEVILIKGAPEFDFSQIIDRLEAKQHQTVLEVNLDSVAHNLNFFRSRLNPDTKIVCMVKAFGYGAGSYEIAKTMQDRGAGYLAVAVHDEGVDLRKAGITMPIMVLNPFVLNYKAMFSYNLEPEVFSINECKEIIREAEKYGITNYPVHIKLDSGMHRLGFVKEELPELIDLLKGQNAIYPKSVFSHLSVADEPEQDDYTAMQFGYFNECCEMLASHFDHKILRHILNTTGAARFPEHQYDMVRLGIGIYGIKTVLDGTEDELKPVSSLRSVIISIKEWPAGTTIGYGRKGKIGRPSRIATIPIGYADGMDRHFGNGATSMWINGHLCPTVGNICMDLCMVDVTDVPCKVGDAVEIFGEHIPVEQLAKVRGTIPYEVLTSISERVKRVYFRE